MTMTKVLLIEDDTILQQMYQDKFTFENFKVMTAVNGQEGIDKMRVSKPDFVLLDLGLPVLSGFDMLKLVQKDPGLKKIPILVLTNIYVDREDLVKNYGVDHVLLKSDFTPDQVVAKVKEILARKVKDAQV